MGRAQERASRADHVVNNTVEHFCQDRLVSKLATCEVGCHY